MVTNGKVLRLATKTRMDRIAMAMATAVKMIKSEWQCGNNDQSEWQSQ